MNKMKKLASLVLALVMALALAAPAFAADTGSITITPQGSDNGTNLATYHYYQIFRASVVQEATDDKATSASYYLENGTDDALRNELDAVVVNGKDVFTFNQSADGSQWIVTLNEGFSEGDTAAIAAALNISSITSIALSNGEFKQDTDEGKAVADNLPLGYYLITSNLGTNLVLQTLGDVEIQSKNEEITSDKTVETANLTVGEHAKYTITIGIPASANVGDIVTVYDTMDDHLAMLDSNGNITTNPNDLAIKATVEGEDVNFLDDFDDSVVVNGFNASLYTFVRQFEITKDMLGKSVELTYEAELLQSAVDDTGYVNKVFANIPGYVTKETDVDVYTFDFDLDKNFADVSGDDAANYSATFTLTDENGDKIEFIKDSTGYVVADSSAIPEDVTTDLIVNGKDIINIRGLAAGDYTLTETATADGYNLLTESVTVTITDTTKDNVPSHDVTYKIGNDSEQTGTVTIENNKGTVLPDTGGIGTTIFYIVGGVLVAGAVVLLITKRRMNIDKD